jgi:hypothetical protein
MVMPRFQMWVGERAVAVRQDPSAMSARRFPYEPSRVFSPRMTYCIAPEAMERRGQRWEEPSLTRRKARKGTSVVAPSPA